MSEIIEFINLQKDIITQDPEDKFLKEYDFIYVGTYRDYYLNIVAVLCDINIFYYLDNIDYNIERGNVIIIFDQSINNDEQISSIENTIQLIKNKNQSFFTNQIKFIYKDIKSNLFKYGLYNVEETEEEEIVSNIIKEKILLVDKEGEEDQEQFELYEFEILDQVFNPILTF